MDWGSGGGDSAKDKGGGLPGAFSTSGRSGLTGISSAFKRSLGDHDAVANPETERTQKYGILVYGTKNSGKSAMTADLPRPNGGRTVFISFDEATYEGLVNYWGKDWLEKNNVEVYEVTKPIEAMGFSGYDPSRPKTAEAVLGYVAYLLESFEEAGDVDNIIFDHWQAAHEDIGQSYCRGLADVGPTDKLTLPQWGPRKPMLRMLMMKGWAIAKHAIVATGYKEEEVTTMQQVGGKSEVSTIIRDCRWIAPYQAPFKVSLEPYTTRQKKPGNSKDVGETKYLWHIDGSKNPLFPEGETVDMTGKSISHFWTRGEELEAIANE